MIEITIVQGVANCTGIFRLVARYISECDTYEANTFMECGMYASTTALHAIYNLSSRILWRCRSPTWFLLHPTVRAKLPDFCQCTYPSYIQGIRLGWKQVSQIMIYTDVTKLLQQLSGRDA